MSEKVTQSHPEESPNRQSNGSGGGSSNHGERLVRIEAHLEHVAKREDVSEIKALIERKEPTMLRWLIGVTVIAAVSLLAAIFRSFF